MDGGAGEDGGFVLYFFVFGRTFGSNPVRLVEICTNEANVPSGRSNGPLPVPLCYEDARVLSGRFVQAVDSMRKIVE